MDAAKTGRLIKQARTDKGLTQKQLAEQLHLSDRTVSKWERGAGLPDIALLEPLADALDITVQSLLRGETGEESAEATLRTALRLLVQQSRRALRRNLSRLAAGVLLSAFLGYFIYGVLEMSGAFLKPVQLEVAATIYQDGTAVGETTVTVDGTLRVTGPRNFSGQFSLPEAEATTTQQVTAFIEWDAPEQGYQTIHFSLPGLLDAQTGVERYLYISPDMTHFAITLADGRIVATHEGLAALQAVERYRYALDHTGQVLFGYLQH